MITYVENIKDVKEYNKLSDSVGWGKREESLLKEALDRTLFSVSAYDEGEIVGYGRVIGDETCFLYIQDIMVSPKYQGQKIGSNIMYRLLDKIKEYRKVSPDIRVYLGASLNKEDFYRRFGFHTRKEARLGEGMILMNENEKETMILDWEEEIKEDELEEVIQVLENDGVIIFPTDTVYGIACNCFSERAIQKIFDIKKRAANKPIGVLTDSVKKIETVATITPVEKKIIEKYMPGALTVVLNKKKGITDVLTAGLDTIGVRIPDNEIALKILSRFPFPLATTSANESGEAAGIDIKDFVTYFDGKVDVIIDGGPTKIQVASTVVKVEDEKINVLREGTIKIEE